MLGAGIGAMTHPLPGLGAYSAPLGFENDLRGGMANVGSLIGELRGARAPDSVLNQLANRTRQEASVRGIGGPLAATVSGDVQGRFINDFESQKLQKLMQLEQLRNSMAMAYRQQEEQRRQQMLQAAQAQEAQRRAGAQGIGGGIGSILGGIGGILLAPVTGGASIPAGIALGGGLGSGIGSLF